MNRPVITANISISQANLIRIFDSGVRVMLGFFTTEFILRGRRRGFSDSWENNFHCCR